MNEKITIPNIPDYVGCWDIWESVRGEGFFQIFVQESKKLKSGLERIKGILRDDTGVANVKGDITKKYLDLSAEYDLESIAKGGQKSPIILVGAFEEGIYTGRWKDREGEERDFVIEKVKNIFRYSS